MTRHKYVRQPEDVLKRYRAHLKRQIEKEYPKITVINVFLESESVFKLDPNMIAPIWVYYEYKGSFGYSNLSTKNRRHNGHFIIKREIYSNIWDKYERKFRL